MHNEDGNLYIIYARMSIHKIIHECFGVITRQASHKITHHERDVITFAGRC